MDKKPLMALAAVSATVLLMTACKATDDPAPDCNNRAGSVNCAQDLESDTPRAATTPDSEDYWELAPLDRPGSITDQATVDYWELAPLDRPGSITDQNG